MTAPSDRAPRGVAVGAFFDAHQRATVEAAMARIIPTDDQPGAREADAVTFVDRYLSGIGYIYAKPDGSGFEALEGKRAEAWTRRIELLREIYASGITELDRRSTDRFGSDFLSLTDDDQDQVLRALEEPAVGPGGTGSSAAINSGGPVEPALQQTSTEVDLGFFQLLVAHTRQGFYADPIYGGNRDQVGWRVIGFPGPASLAEVHSGAYSSLSYFADDRSHPGQEDSNDS